MLGPPSGHPLLSGPPTRPDSQQPITRYSLPLRGSISTPYLREASTSARSTSAASGGVVCSRMSSLIAPPLTLESHEETSLPVRG